MQIANSLIPIFSIIILGVLLRRGGFFNKELTDGLNQFAFFIGLPIFLFYKLGSATSLSSMANHFVIVLLTATIGAAGIGWLVAFILNSPNNKRGVLIQACFRGNLAFMGLPLILFATYDLPEAQRSILESAVLIALPPVVIFYNFASVIILSIYNSESSKQFSWRETSYKVATNPILLACLLGLAVRSTGYPIPTAIFRTCEILGASAFPVALLGIGSQLASAPLAGQWNESLISTGIKCVACPAIGWLTGNMLGLDGSALQVVLILCAVPTAVSSFVLADQMKGDSTFAASSVVICTALSAITLSVLLWLTATI